MKTCAHDGHRDLVIRLGYKGESSGGRLGRVVGHFDGDPFVVTSGDGVEDVDLAWLATSIVSTSRGVRRPGRGGLSRRWRTSSAR
jgi:hypothetical protein